MEVIDVEEIQQQNQRLLSVVRELSHQNEEYVKEKTQLGFDLQQQLKVKQTEQLEQAYQSIELLKEQRKALEIRLEALLHGISLNAVNENGDQRLRILDPQSIATAAAGGLNGNNGATAGLVADLQQQLRDQSASFDHSKSDWERSRGELLKSSSDLQAKLELVTKEHALTVRTLTQQVDQARSQHSDARMQLAKVQSELNSYQALYADLKTRHAESTREIEMMRGRADQLNAQLIANQKQLQSLDQERKQVDEEKRRLAVQNVQLQSSSTLATKSSTRYAQENAELNAQLSHLQSLITNLQTMQTVFETRESTARDQLTREKEALRVDWLTVKKQLDEERSNAREMDQHQRRVADDLREKLETSQKTYHETREQLIETRTNYQSTQQRLTQLESELKASQDRLEAITVARQREKDLREGKIIDASASHMTKEQQLQSDLSKAESAIAEYVAQIAEQKQDLTNLTKLASDTENELQSLTLESRLYKSRTEKELQELRENKSQLTARIEHLGQTLKQNETGECVSGRSAAPDDSIA